MWGHTERGLQPLCCLGSSIAHSVMSVRGLVDGDKDVKEKVDVYEDKLPTGN